MHGMLACGLLVVCTALVAVESAVPPSAEVLVQVRQVEFLRLQAEAQDAEQRGDLDTAIARLQLMRNQLEAAGPDERRRLAEVQAGLDRLRGLQGQQERADHAALRRQAQAQQLAARDLQHQQLQSLFDARMRRIRELEARHHFELALEEARLLLDEYPRHPEVRKRYTSLIREVHRQRSYDLDQKQEFARQEAAENVGRSLLPQGFDGMPVFPDDWHERIERRQVAWVVAGVAADDSALRNQLAQRISVSFRGLEPAECLDQLATASGLNLILGSAIRASPRAMVTLEARNMRLDHVLDWVVAQAQVHWQIRKGAILVTEVVDPGTMSTRIYDIADLLYAAPDFRGVELGLSDLGGGEDGFAAIDTLDQVGGLAGEDLVDLIRVTLGEERWSAPGVSLRTYGTQLLVTANDALHEQLRQFLRQMNESEELLVRVNARWVTLQKSFMEDIGVKLVSPDYMDMGRPPRGLFEQQDVEGQELPGYGWVNEYTESRNTGMVRHMLPIEDPFAAVAGATRRGLTFQFGFLGIWQLSAIFQAAEERTSVRMLDAVDVTTRNGARGNTFVGRSQAYISDYDITVSGDDDGGFEPVIKTVSEGQSFEVRPLVSADRKYITLDFKPMLVEVEFDTAQIRALQVRDNEADLGDVILIAPPSIQRLTLGINLPIVKVLGARTRVMIPDRGSVLVGGFTKRSDQHAAAQIPVLGNIPYLGRLFGRRGIQQRDTTVYLLTSATIILYSELEAQL
jgi:hypothetical protein